MTTYLHVFVFEVFLAVEHLVSTDARRATLADAQFIDPFFGKPHAHHSLTLDDGGQLTRVEVLVAKGGTRQASVLRSVHIRRGVRLTAVRATIDRLPHVEILCFEN